MICLQLPVKMKSPCCEERFGLVRKLMYAKITKTSQSLKGYVISAVIHSIEQDPRLSGDVAISVFSTVDLKRPVYGAVASLLGLRRWFGNNGANKVKEGQN